MSKSRIINISFILTLFISSCVSKSKGGEFSREGVSFTYAPGWNISEQEDLDGAGYYLSVEKQGFDESGLVAITWVNGEIGATEYLLILQDSFREQGMLGDLVFNTEKSDSFNGYPSTSCVFHFNILTIKHSGIIHILFLGEKTFSIVKQEALEDRTKNKEGFQTIESTFKVD